MTDIIEKSPEQIAAIEAEMEAQGSSPYESGQVDYFGFEHVERFVLPDGVSWIEHRILNEGQRRAYLNKTNREVKVQRVTGDAFMKMSPGDEKKYLLEAAICGWNLVRQGSVVAFTSKNLTEFLDKSNPKIIDLIEKEVRKANSWLMSDLSLDEIDKEIENLQELRQKKIEEEAGKDD